MPPTPSDSNNWLQAALGGTFQPFPWQRRLLSQLLAGDLPDALDLPTGLGKTSVMAIWLVARALGAPNMPRRLVYVVDRRAVVDQATRVAEDLAAWVASNSAIQDALGTKNLPISTLRGQHVDNKRWLDDPTTPAIVVGTVDMIGSRLLFEGYACTRKMRPYHAGFLGCDTLFVLDEAHLVPPFEQTLRGFRRDEFWPETPLDAQPKARVLSLSATGRGYHNAFTLDAADAADPVVLARVHAKKSLQWQPLGEKDSLPDFLANAAWEVAEAAGPNQRVIVFSNSRDTADKAQAALLKCAKSDREKKASQPKTELLVGGRRIRERVAAEIKLQELGFIAGDNRVDLGDHAFLFTTAAGEVGVDLDADHAVADVVAWERMVQRLGRVNRRGKGDANIIIVAHPKDNDWLEKVRPVFDLLAELPSGHKSGSPHALGEVKEANPSRVQAASTPEPLYPALNLPTIEAWAMTSLKEHTGRPEVRPWLRGWVDEPPQTSVLWRRYLPTAQHDKYLESAPPHASEKVETYTYRVASWVFARASKTLAQLRAKDDNAQNLKDSDIVVWAINGADEYEKTEVPWTLATLAFADKRFKDRFERAIIGRQLLVDARLGGLSEVGLLDEKDDSEIIALEDEAWPTIANTSDGLKMPFRVRREKVEPEAHAQDGAAKSRRPSADWRETLRLPWHTGKASEDVSEWLIVERHRADPTSEDGRSAGREQSLVEHQSWAAKEAGRIATNLGLPPHLKTALVLAARLHDEGKRADRWQRAFSAPHDAKGPYAKTRGPVLFRILDGYRHELGSLSYVEKDPEFLILPADDQTLVLHLVAAHHGFARPAIAPTGCDDAPPSMVVQRAGQAALRFVELQKKWGPWRLAWLEALLRSADQIASRNNETADTEAN